jgi:peptidoglycan/LPS O-acetylase OafA/YrhL
VKNRQDIQALRGWAVLAVVIFHAKLGWLEAGYLGVDVFFVLSGFLITTMVIGQVSGGRFSFIEFYFRRAKRLLPAAYATFFVTALLSMWLLTSHELAQFAQQLTGAVTFFANVVLWRQGSYFGGESELKPLLHTWSLSIEEQYYMLLPAALWFIPARHRFKFVVACTLASLALCLAVLPWRPDVAFFMLPTRAWELGVGSIGAFLAARPAYMGHAKRLFWPAMAVVLILPWHPISRLHPGADAALICVATLIVILSQHTALNNVGVVGAMAKIGDWSYSLYLVHWPLFALLNNVWVGEPPVAYKVVAIASSVFLAWLQYTWVEHPIRQTAIAPSHRRIAVVLSASALLIASPFAFIQSQPSHRVYEEIRRGNVGLSASCAFDRIFALRPECQSKPDATVLVWGDSYAMHLVPGVQAEMAEAGVAQATKYVCGPLLGVAPIADLPGAMQNRFWAQGCLSFNEEVLAQLKSDTKIKTVVLSSVFKQYMTPGDFHTLQRTSVGLTEHSGGVDSALAAIQRTITAIRALGKRVVVVAPPPAMDWDAGRCAERLLRGLPIAGHDRDCKTKDADYQVKRANVLAFLARLRQEADVEVITFDEVLRDGTGYRPVADGHILYIANGHLSYDGSVYLAHQMRMGELIAKGAR